MAEPLVTGTSRETGILSVSDLRLAGALGVSESHPSSEGSTLARPPGKGSPSAKPGSRQTPTASPPSPGAPVPPMLCARRGHQNFPGPGPPPGPWRPARAMVRGPQDRSWGQGAGGWRCRQCKRWKDEILRATGTQPPASSPRPPSLLQPQCGVPRTCPERSALAPAWPSPPGGPPCNSGCSDPAAGPVPRSPQKSACHARPPRPWFGRRLCGWVNASRLPKPLLWQEGTASASLNLATR